MKKILLSLAVALSMLAACGKTEVSINQLEEARATAKANSEFNAQMYKAANPRFTADFSIISRSDTAQDAECPQGDGWAELSIMKVEGKVVDKTSLMCSTYSGSVGCFRKEDFDKDPNLAGQNGRCDRKAPFPIPSIVKK